MRIISYFFIVVFNMFFFESCLLAIDENSAVIARYPTPVYSFKDISELYYDKVGKPSLRLDKLGHLRELEFIALPETKFIVLEEFIVSDNVLVYRVVTNDYPSVNELYLDARFVELCRHSQLDRTKVIPVAEDIITNMLSMVGSPYRWGGNYYQGINEMSKFYPYKNSELSENMVKAWCLEGVDCSGLLYQATGGAIPRNTSQLIDYGEAVKIADNSLDEICSKVKPLDMIVWKGHVVYVLDNENVIESRPRYKDGAAGGVRIHSLKKVLKEIMSKRIPVDDYSAEKFSSQKRFVIRRFL